MRKITAYKITGAPDSNSLEELINNYIKDGWEPIGRPFYDTHEWYQRNKIVQALVRYEEIK